MIWMVTPAEEKGWFVRYGRRGGRHGSICREKTTRDHGARKGILGLLPPRSRSTPPFRLPTPHHMRESDVGGRPAVASCWQGIVSSRLVVVGSWPSRRGATGRSRSSLPPPTVRACTRRRGPGTQAHPAGEFISFQFGRRCLDRFRGSYYGQGRGVCNRQPSC